MIPRQHRVAAQRAVRRALFELGQARGAYAAASTAGGAAALKVVNAHLTDEYAPQWALPRIVASQPGLMAAVHAKLRWRFTDAAAEVAQAVTGMRCALDDMHAAARLLCGAPATAGTDASQQRQSPSAAANAVAFDPEVLGDTTAVFAALTLPAIDAMVAETVAMYAADVRLKERLQALLCGIGQARWGLAPPSVSEPPRAEAAPSREELHAWLDAWAACPSVDPRRLGAIETALADDMAAS